MTDQKIRVAQDMIDAWNALDWERVISLFAPDGVLHSVMQEPLAGREAIRERLAVLAEGLERLDIRVKAMGVVDDRVFMERLDVFDARGSHGEVPVVGVLRIEDGLVAEWLEYYDRATLLRGMGLSADFAE
ncbi:nuclear transport factor 2 family protein [Planotetraspora sp. A-T 1434]|uniref:nuclear transport factor 2 family protein n=1 Tax=Planotetraspora sp. A-T 1434 TaxID=2979219 RepID=UPI0021C0F2E4|nr:nuclear transport factor 2 family protein [Planotetraspora sp. A-T 1434]MCT9935302.1 nuclear transport factor 2 family protein [Planotetraspora sp. A-T 1434]